jgi:diguanylate cyclase (GGDEF)-like protein
MVRDALTGVYARVALLERLEEEIHRGRRYGEPFSLLLLDLDHFKSVNDAFGHARGDATLIEFVQRVQSGARNSDVLFRLGGDEFVLFLPRTAHEQATVLASRLVERISSEPFAGQPPLSLTVSVGVASLPDDGSGTEELLARADARMYEAKRDGRARVVSVDHTRDAELTQDEGTRLIERLDALERANRFFDTLPSARTGVLCITGPAGVGRSRVLRELEKLAAMRGHRVITLIGKAEHGLEPLATLRACSTDAAQLPASLSDPADVAEALRRALSNHASPISTITIDNPGEVDRKSLAVVCALLAGTGPGTAVGVIHTSELDAEPALPETPLRDTIEIAPLTREGVRAWMRSIFRWEPPAEFVEWMFEQSGGLPSAVREIILQLVQRRSLVRDDTRWSLAEGFRALGRASSARVVPELRGIQAPSTELIGRERPLRQLLRLIRTTRLVTLCGPGGVGKTRLAIEAAREALDSFRDGVAFVALHRSVSEVELATAIASTLKLPGLPGPDPWIALARQLRLSRMLVVVDGLDSAASAGRKLVELLEHAADLRILVTSRMRLQVPDEWVFHLEGLRVPRWPDPDRARGFSAVQLFRTRALAVNPHFALDDAEAPSVSRICQLLDGSPLALEIAAAQTATLSCHEIAVELETSLEGLASNLPATPPDQQRFRAVMEQTWRSLPEETRSVLRRAAVFEADFDGLAAHRIAGAQPADLDLLQARALLVRHADGRYAIHRLVREYARLKLDEFTRDRQACLAAFAGHYLEVARELGEQLPGTATMSSAPAAFSAELTHIRRAWALALADEQHALILSGGKALFDCLMHSGQHADAEAIFAHSVNWFEATNSGHGTADVRVAAFLLARYGACLLLTGRIEEARRRLVVALARVRRLGLPAEESFCLRHLARVELANGSDSAAEEYARGAIALARRSPDPHTLIVALLDAAALATANCATQRSVECLLEALGVEGPSAGKAAVWASLIEVVEPLAQQGNIRMAGAVLLQVLGDRTADAEVQARAQGMLDSMRPAIGEPSGTADAATDTVFSTADTRAPLHQPDPSACS